MKELKKAELLYHAGLLLFSIAPSLIVFLLLLLSAGAGSAISLATGLFTIAALQIYGILYEKGVLNNPIPLKLSFWTLKMLTPVKDSSHAGQRFQSVRRSYVSSSDSGFMFHFLNKYHHFSDSSL